MLGGDYIIPIKENQKNFYNDLKLYFDQEKCDEIIAGKENINIYILLKICIMEIFYIR